VLLKSGLSLGDHQPSIPGAMKSIGSGPITNLLVIGYGNTLRGDDGVGPRVAEAIEELNLPGVSTLSCGLLTPELADPISRARCVVFVDAAVDKAGKVLVRPLGPADTAQIMAHAADPRTMLALARDVFGHAPRAWWLTIPAQNLGIGEEFSTRAKVGLKDAIVEIKKILQQEPASTC
jgi:hydrogenase maturation protease